MGDQDAKKFTTIRKTDLLKNWLVVSAVNIPANDSSNKNDDASYIAQQAQARIEAHGPLQEILSKRTLRSGKVMYDVRWNDGTRTQEGIRMLREVDLDMLMGFHEPLDLDNDSSSSSSSSGSVYQERTSMRKFVVEDSDSEDSSPEYSNDTDELESSEDDKPIIHHIRPDSTRKSSRPHTKEASKKRHFDLATPPVFQQQKGPMAAVPYYTNGTFVERHWIDCLKCKEKGYPNGPAADKGKNKRGGRPRRPMDDIFEMTPEEEEALQGRLFLCITCTAAVHQGCLPVPHKRFLRECIKNDKERTEFQCALCLSAIASKPDCIPACDGCHQVHNIADLKLLPNTKTSMASPSTNSDQPLSDRESPTQIATPPDTIDDHPTDPNGLLRCSTCRRAFHDSCLPTVTEATVFDNEDVFKGMSRQTIIQTCLDRQKCTECITFNKKVEKIVTWRIAGESADKRLDITFDEAKGPKEYLVKWVDTSYRHLTWVPEEWISRTCKQLYNKYCDRVRHYKHAIEDDLVPKAWKTVERILTAVDSYNTTITKGPARRVHKILVKFNDLNFDEACWDTPPPEDSDLYSFFIDAYKQYLHACTVKPPTKMKKRVEEVRYAATRENYSQHEIKQQPNFIAGGTLLPHQLDGLNWLIYQWERSSPCILADDMGLGKTIQIVSFLNLLFKKFGVYPFLVIVPNSTATNWLREFNKWAPDMVVSTYYGSAKSRRLVRQHELFRGGEQDGIRVHAVILTYESATSDISLFGRTKFWPAMVVDEAQRLKNNESLLFQKLKSLQWDHTILMTGTPLQNNIRELMNLMHFVDPQKFADVEELEAKYEELSRDVVQELHDQLKPYFLRRTKELVLKIPPKSEIIVPVSMTPLQKEVCKGLLEKNLISYAMLDKSDKGSSSKSKSSLNNILMQLRKALNHPYLIPGIELQQDTPEITQRILIDASSKLKVLHQMLPKLLKGGHRILIFSTMQLTLDILEDYLNYEGVKYVRLDGTTPTIDRVKNIDAFNKTGSDINVFLLTTRAGGVGINLATADTVILWDFDPNPHQDQQAIGRAHRFGQTSPVLVLKFMTRFSVEEKIAQIAKKKLVLDHLVVNRMDDEDLEENDVESIIKFGTQALFDDDKSKDIIYDSHAIDKLLDRSHISTVEAPEQQEETDESQKGFSFSFARVWNQDKEGATEELADDTGPRQEENDFWSKFLQEKKKQYEEEQQKKEQLGRGARRRGMISYREDLLYANSSQVSNKKKRKQAPQSATEPEGNGEDGTYVDEPNAGGEATDSDATISDSDLSDFFGSKKRKQLAPFPQVPQQPQESQSSSQIQAPQQPAPKRQRSKKPRQQSPQQPRFQMYSPPAAPNYQFQYEQRIDYRPPQQPQPSMPPPMQQPPPPQFIQFDPARPPPHFNVPVSLPMRPHSMQPPTIPHNIRPESFIHHRPPPYLPTPQPTQPHLPVGSAPQHHIPPTVYENIARGGPQLREALTAAMQQRPSPQQQQHRPDNHDLRYAQVREAIQQRLSMQQQHEREIAEARNAQMRAAIQQQQHQQQQLRHDNTEARNAQLREVIQQSPSMDPQREREDTEARNARLREAIQQRLSMEPPQPRQENAGPRNAQMPEAVQQRASQQPQHRQENTEATHAQLRDALNNAIQQRLRQMNHASSPPVDQNMTLQQQALRLIQMGASGQYGARSAQEMLYIAEQLRNIQNGYVPPQYIGPTAPYLSNNTAPSSSSPQPQSPQSAFYNVATSAPQQQQPSSASPSSSSAASQQRNTPPQHPQVNDPRFSGASRQ